MVDFRKIEDYKTEEEIELRKEIDGLCEKLDAIEIIRAFRYLQNEKCGSFTISKLHGLDAFYKLSGLLLHSVEIKTKYVFEGPKQTDYNYTIKLEDGRIYNLIVMEKEVGNNTEYLFSIDVVGSFLKKPLSPCTEIKDFEEIIKYYGELYKVDEYAPKGNARTRNQ